MRKPKFRRLFHECLFAVLLCALLAFAASFLTGSISLRVSSLVVGSFALWTLCAAAINKEL